MSTPSTEQNTKRFFRLKEITKRYSISETTWYRYVKNGIAPKGVSLGMRAVAWREEDLEAYENGKRVWP